MERDFVEKRENWKQSLLAQGMTFAEMYGESYWTEGVAYRFTQQEVAMIQSVSQELHGMCLEATDYVIRNDLFDRFNIPEEFIPLVKCSWEDHYPYICGRFDLAYDGVNPPKMVEYNADSAVGMPETAIHQQKWLEDHLRAGTLPANAKQYNELFDSLIEAWSQVARQVTIPGPMYFTGLLGMENGNPVNQEIYRNVLFMKQACELAGLPAKMIDLQEIGWDGQSFVDQDNNPMGCMYKIFPWHWMCESDFGPHIANNLIGVIEAPWKMVMGNKALLPVLSKLYPNHPNLLKASFDPRDMKGDYVVKPIQGHEGMNVSIVSAGRTMFSTDGMYEQAPCVYQELAKVRDFNGIYPIIGSWVTAAFPNPKSELKKFNRGGHACGLAVFEENSPIVSQKCRFVPHYVL